MKLTKSWLEDYIEIPFNIEELCHHLTMAGLEVDDVLQKTAQDTFKGDLGKQQAGSAPATLGQKYSGGGDAPAGGTDQAGAPAKAGGKAVPGDIQKAVDSLSPAQKKELAQLL